MHDNLPKPQELHHQKCVPCEGGIDPLTPAQFAQYLETIKGWRVVQNNKALEKEFKFKNFKQALEFVNRVGGLAEGEGHHPDINLYGWNKVRITLSTHAIDGLSINDFVLASKIDRLPSPTV